MVSLENITQCYSGNKTKKMQLVHRSNNGRENRTHGLILQTCRIILITQFSVIMWVDARRSLGGVLQLLMGSVRSRQPPMVIIRKRTVSTQYGHIQWWDPFESSGGSKSHRSTPNGVFSSTVRRRLAQLRFIDRANPFFSIHNVYNFHRPKSQTCQLYAGRTQKKILYAQCGIRLSLVLPQADVHTKNHVQLTTLQCTAIFRMWQHFSRNSAIIIMCRPSVCRLSVTRVYWDKTTKATQFYPKSSQMHSLFAW